MARCLDDQPGRPAQGNVDFTAFHAPYGPGFDSRYPAAPGLLLEAHGACFGSHSVKLAYHPMSTGKVSAALPSGDPLHLSHTDAVPAE